MIKRLSVAKEKFKDTCIQEEAKETHTHTQKSKMVSNSKQVRL